MGRVEVEEEVRRGKLNLFWMRLKWIINLGISHHSVPVLLVIVIVD